MRDQRWGRVLAITSIGARQPIVNLAASSAARAATTSFIKNLATEVGRDNVTANTIQPGLHATDRVKALHAGGGDQGGGLPVPERDRARLVEQEHVDITGRFERQVPTPTDASDPAWSPLIPQ